MHSQVPAPSFTCKSGLGCPGSCVCDPSRLLPRVCELGDRLEANGTDLLHLRHGLRTPLASPELLALANEGGILEQRAREGAALVAKLRTENAAAAWSVDCDRQRIRALHRERQRLLQELGSLEQTERKLREDAREADRKLGVERRQAEERTYGQETALGIIASRASSAEQRWQEAEAHASRLRASTAEAESAAAASSRASAIDADRYSREISELQKSLAQGAQESSQPCGESEALSQVQIHQQVQSEMKICEDLRRAEHILAEQVEESQSKGVETEKRALQVARELVDSSQAIAWLQNEVAIQRENWAELDALRSHNDMARQRLQHNAELTAADMNQHNQSAEQFEHPELCAVSEALQLAWEGEAKGHRQAQQRLQSIHALCLTPARQHLLQLAALSKQWRQCLNHWRSVGQETGAVSQSAQEQGLLPAVEDAAKELRQAISIGAARDICGCVENLVQETVRWVLAGRAGSIESSVEPVTAQAVQTAQKRVPGASLASGMSRKGHVNHVNLQVPEPEGVEDSDGPSLTSSSLSLPLREAATLTRSSVPNARGRSTNSACFTSHAPPLPLARGADSLAGTAGPLYRLEGASPSFRPFVRRPSAPLASSLSRLSLELEDCFDDYSVHRPQQEGDERQRR